MSDEQDPFGRQHKRAWLQQVAQGRTQLEPACSAAKPTVASMGLCQLSAAMKCARRSMPSGSSAVAQASMAARNTGDAFSSSAPMPDHWLPLPAQESRSSRTNAENGAGLSHRASESWNRR